MLYILLNTKKNCSELKIKFISKMKNYDLHFKTDHVRSLLHTEVLKVFIDLKCLQLVFLGRRSLKCL